ncbi:hypothetical protein [Streptomyces luteireticuli]|uniref:Uncharacterized protein n=1 Tax=Streptomyces luteireticuli TaxID=173858 RepID=A0ABN0Z275_9ACTN
MFVLRLVLRLIRKTVLHLARPRDGSVTYDASVGCTADDVLAELGDDLPDEDLGQDLGDCLDQYHLGSKPRCEEVEYLELVQDAIDRIERGR